MSISEFIAILGRLFGVSAVRYFIIAGAPFLAFYILYPGRLSKFKIQERSATSKDFLREVLNSIESALIFSAIAFAILYTPLKKYTLVYDHLTDYPVWYLVISVLLCLIIHDAYFYWMHRLLHHRRLFKITHLLHHRSTNPSPWTSYSFHFLEGITEGCILLVISVVMPVHALTIILFTIASLVINVYGHLGYEIMPRRFRNSVWFEIFNTSVHHNMHHSRFKYNYGLYLRFWDRTMGTEHPDYVKEYDRIQEQRFGSLPVDRAEELIEAIEPTAG